MATDIAALKKTGTDVSAPAKTFPEMLEKFKSEIARALPAHITPDRMARMALTAFRLNPKLAECQPASVFAAVVMSSQLGLEIGVLGRSYLVPYKVNKKTKAGWESHYECQFIPGWKGLVDLMSRSGQGAVWTGAVFKGDTFDWGLGDAPFVKHKPAGGYDPKDLTHVYAIGHVKGAEHKIIEVWPISRVWAHRDKFNKVGESHYSFKNQEMYARKIPLLQVLKYMPMSAELATAMALDDSATVGAQNLTFDDAIDGTWVPVENDEGSGDGSGQMGGGAGERGEGSAPGTAAGGLEGGAGAPSAVESGAGGVEAGARTKEGEQSSGAAQSKEPPAPPVADVIKSIRSAQSLGQLDDLISLFNGPAYTEVERKSVNQAYHNRAELLRDAPAPKASTKARGGME